MSGERPWWLPTAVFVAPVCGLLAVVSLVAADQDLGPGWLTGILVVVALVLLPSITILDLGRREDQHRDKWRPADLNRWGAPAGERTRPFARVGHELLWWFALVGAIALWAAGMVSLPRDVRAPVAVFSLVALIVVGLALLTRSLRNGLVEEQQPFWLRQVIWRWPVTTSIAALALGTMAALSVLGDVIRRDYFSLIWLPFAYAVLIRGPWRVLRDPNDPNRRYGGQA